MAYELNGKLHKKFDTENKTQTFQAREFVVETVDGQYTQFIKFQLVQDRCSLLDPFEEGEPIKVQFDLRGREWNGKYFTNLNAWRLDKVEPIDSGAGSSQPSVGSSPEAPLPGTSDEPPAMDDEGMDDLPF